MQTYRSLLFVPGARPERFDKAASSGADAVILDLEDSVPPSGKASARDAALGWLSTGRPSCPAGLRINSPRTAEGCADLAALAGCDAAPGFAMVPKAETPVDVEIVREVLPGVPVIAVIESPRGLSHAWEIATKSSAGVLFGGADFSACLGADLADWDAMLVARGTIAAACGGASVPAYDVPYLDVADTEGLAQATARAKALGFSGRTCIHPAQVETVNTVFTPTNAEVDEARAIVDALETAGGGAVLHRGKLVDQPIILAARRTLDRAGLKKG